MQRSTQSRISLLWIALAFAGACADPASDGDDIAQAGSAAQNEQRPYDDEDDAALPDAGGGQATPDAGANVLGDAAVATRDAASGGSSDAGREPSMSDAGREPSVSDAGHEPSVSDAGRGRPDAGQPASDGGVKNDAGTGTCGTVSYANFGMQFMTTYCVACHTGASAQHGVQLDTLAGVQKNKAGVKRQAATNVTMPPLDPKPSAVDREKLAQWLDCGAN